MVVGAPQMISQPVSSIFPVLHCPLGPAELQACPLPDVVFPPHGVFSSLELCCEGPWFTSLQKNGCDKGAHRSYLGTERNTPVIPNWFQPCQCFCCLCYPGEYLRLGTLSSYNWAMVLEACDSLKLMSIYFDLCVDATGVVISLVFSALISMPYLLDLWNGSLW